jgi:hypothetical protein
MPRVFFAFAGGRGLGVRLVADCIRMAASRCSFPEGEGENWCGTSALSHVQGATG